MQRLSKSVIAIVCFYIAFTSYFKSENSCDNIHDSFDIRADTPQKKYVKNRVDDIVNGINIQRKRSIEDLLKSVSKKRTGKCSVKFLESIRLFINDYIAALPQKNVKEASEKIEQSIGNKLDCLLTLENDVKPLVNVKLPRLLCQENACQMTLLYLYNAFRNDFKNYENQTNKKKKPNVAMEKELLLSMFLNLLWKDYYIKNKYEKEAAKNIWSKICSTINLIKEKMLEDLKVIDAKTLLDNEMFKTYVFDFILDIFGTELLPSCGKLCSYLVLDVANQKDLDCSLRIQLLSMIGKAFAKADANIDMNSKIKFFESFVELLKDKCYDIYNALVNTLWNLKAYNNREIMDIVITRILINIKGNSFSEKFLKEMIVSGLMLVSDKITDKKITSILINYLAEEYERTNDYSYKELLLRALFSFNGYEYIFKNEDKLIAEFKLRRLLLKIKDLPSEQSDVSMFINTILKLSAIYGLESFKKYVENTMDKISTNLDDISHLEKDKQTMILLITLFGYYNESFIESYIFEKILSINATSMLKELAMKYLLYTLSRKTIVNKYLKRFFLLDDVRCYAYLISSFLGHKAGLTRLNNIAQCENIGLSTKTVKELVKISLNDAWINDIKHNQSAINILNLDLPKTDQFISYETCGVGHQPAGQPPTFLTNIFYGIEYDERENTKNCNKLSFRSSIIYMLLNNLNTQSKPFFRKLDKNTKNTLYKGTLKSVLYNIAKELNAEIDLKHIRTKEYKYLLNRYTSFVLPENNATKKSLNSYKILLTKISERFLITYIFEKIQPHRYVIKILPYKTASIYWTSKLDNIFKKN